MVKRRNQSEHDNLVGSLAGYLSNNGFKNIRADISGYDSPSKIWWIGKENAAHIPDATADLNGTNYIFEVETEDTIDIDHTAGQWRLFAAHAKNNKGKFVAVVPDNAKAAAERRIAELGITAEVWT